MVKFTTKGILRFLKYFFRIGGAGAGVSFIPIIKFGLPKIFGLTVSLQCGLALSLTAGLFVLSAICSSVYDIYKTVVIQGGNSK